VMSPKNFLTFLLSSNRFIGTVTVPDWEKRNPPIALLSPTLSKVLEKDFKN
jgi:hypothetical protein